MILNSNDIREEHFSLFEGAILNHKLFITVWDFDNHHLLQRSYRLAKVAHGYVAAHPDHLAQLQLIRGSTIKTEICSSIQFCPQKIKKLTKSDRLTNRCREPIGMHHCYTVFQVRDEILNCLSMAFKDVGSLNQSYPHKGIENLGVWANYSCSFAIPVLVDIPIRFFDSLITGSIPIIPNYAASRLHSLGISAKNYVAFDLKDLDNPRQLVASANHIFDKGGVEGAKLRINTTLKQWHVRASLLRIIRACLIDLELKKS